MSSVLLQVVTAPIVNWSEQILSRLSLPNPLSQDVPNPPPDYYTCQFRTNKLQRSKHKHASSTLCGWEGSRWTPSFPPGQTAAHSRPVFCLQVSRQRQQRHVLQDDSETPGGEFRRSNVSLDLTLWIGKDNIFSQSYEKKVLKRRCDISSWWFQTFSMSQFTQSLRNSSVPSVAHRSKSKQDAPQQEVTCQ